MARRAAWGELCGGAGDPYGHEVGFARRRLRESVGGCVRPKLDDVESLPTEQVGRDGDRQSVQLARCGSEDHSSPPVSATGEAGARAG